MSEELNCILVGILAEPEDLMLEREHVIFVNSINELQFALTIISDGPDFLPLDKPITCYANKFTDYDFNDNYYDDLPMRAKDFENFIEDKVVLFRPVQQYKKGEILYSAEPVMVLPKPPGINRNTRLIPMLYLNDTDYEDYDKLIVKMQPIGPFRYFPGQMPIADPIYIHINGYLYGYLAFRVERHNKWIFNYKNTLKRVQCDLFEYENVITYKEVAFVESYLYLQDFANLLAVDGEKVEILDAPSKDVPVDHGTKKEVEYGDDDQGKSPKEDVIEKVLDTLDIIGQGDTEDVSPNKEELAIGTGLEEVEFINRLIKHCRLSGMLYDEDDLYNFHIDLKVNNFVIIAGMSGTGKSRLVSLYAEALGLTQDDSQGRFSFIPVRPTWTDETDLIGFLDTSNNIYRPADTGLLNVLLEAEKNQDKLYLVCFDEMNLARIEHYFAQFLSVLELPIENRVLQLYNSDMVERVYNSHQYPPQVKIARNVLMVGTVNIDESTYAFSDKALDRASILRLKVLPFSRLAELIGGDKINSPNINPAILATQYLNWVNHTGFSLNASENEFLYKLHEQINKIDAKRGIGYRSLRHIDDYLRNIPRDEQGPILNRAKAFDYQLVQKVLPMLRGPQEQLLKLIGIYNETSDEVEDSELLKLMDEYSNISDYNYSRNEIKQKAKELRWFGYAS